MANTEKEKLFQDFAPNSKREWEDKIHSDLKGADYDISLPRKNIPFFDVKSEI